MYLPTRVKSGSSRFTCVLYAGLAKGGFSTQSRGASYTRMRLIPEYIRYIQLIICIAH